MARTTESTRARRRRVERQAFATAASLRAVQGPQVVAQTLPMSGETVLIRRVDLVRVLSTGVWPEPITARARQMIADMGGNWAADPEQIEKNMASAAAMVRAAVVVPPKELLDGKLEVEDLTAAMCKPLFVEETPDDDQLFLVAPGDPEPEDMDKCVRFQPLDLAWLAHRIMAMAPGGLATFRREQGGAVQGVESEEDDGPADE